MLNSKVKVISNYLNKTMRPATISFQKDYFQEKVIGKVNKYDRTVLSNPLFTIYHNQNDILNFTYKNVPNLDITQYVLPFKYGLDKKEDDNFVSYSTKGQIPIRWLYMIKDFHFKESIIEPDENIDYYPLLKELPKNTFNKIINDTLTPKSKFGFKVTNYPEIELKEGWYLKKIWGTYNKSFTQYTSKILEECGKFESLKPVINKSYDILFKDEGGINILTEDMYEFIKYCHTVEPYRVNDNSLIGTNSYYSNKNVTTEELICLYLALKELGVEVEII